MIFLFIFKLTNYIKNKFIKKANNLCPDRELTLLAKIYDSTIQGNYCEVNEACCQLADLFPRDPEYACLMASSFNLLTRHSEATLILQKFIALFPDEWKPKNMLGMQYLMLGDYRAGFHWLEHRKTKQKFLPSPTWQGENIEGKTLLIRCEEGFGDSILFLRYIPNLSQYRCRIVVELFPPLHCLFERFALSDPDGPVPQHDVQVRLMSLPYLFKTDLATVPPPILIGTRHPVKNRIGIAWKGRAQHPNDILRSIDYRHLEPLLQISGIEFVSLQKELTSEEAAFLDTYGVRRPRLASFADTLCEIEKCERVICADTVIAHLAGSIGVPVWVALPYFPDWRWLLERTDSPWYPSARLFRQCKINSWAEPIEAIRQLIL